jgi:hypothetical protein
MAMIDTPYGAREFYNQGSSHRNTDLDSSAKVLDRSCRYDLKNHEHTNASSRKGTCSLPGPATDSGAGREGVRL